MGTSATNTVTLDQINLRYAIPVFYSTNPWLKYFINSRYRDGKHFVWCSEAYDGSRQKVQGQPAMAASSSPIEIYRELVRDTQRRDQHSFKITQQKNSLTSIATKWRKEGSISEIELKEIIALVTDTDFTNWRPLLYVIPKYQINASRITVVDPDERAGRIHREYTIKDLDSSEFDALEVNLC